MTLVLRARLSFREPQDGARARGPASPGGSTGSTLASTGPEDWASGSAGSSTDSPVGAARRPASAKATGGGRSERGAPSAPSDPAQPSGVVAPGLRALEDDTADIPGGRARISAENDRFHHLVNPRSRHTRGLAFDQTIRDPARSGEAAEHMRARLRGAGLGEGEFRVIDEYRHPSAHATGGHIHTQFNSADAARRYEEVVRKRADARKSLDR